MTTTPIADKLSSPKAGKVSNDPTISDAIAEIVRTYHLLVDTVADLSQRLAPVIVSRPLEGMPLMISPDGEATHSSVYMQLVEHNARLSSVQRQVADLLRDVQL